MSLNVQAMQAQADPVNLLQRIRDSLSKASLYTQRHKRLNSTLMTVTIIGSAVTAFITGLTAVEGPTVIPGVLDWRLACSVGAVLSGVTTLASGYSQQFNISEKLVLGSQCVGRLRALELVATTQSRDASEITDEYADILKTYAEAVGS